MAELTRDQLIELITKEVLKIVNREEVSDYCDASCPPALVIGDVKKLPKDIAEAYNCIGIEAYEGDIQPFDKIFITDLTTLELADIALGRSTKSVQCAVINGLLCGKEIFLYEFALEHRKFEGKGSRAFYLLLEAYVKTVIGFGIQWAAGEASTQGQDSKGVISSMAPLSGVVTEAKAKELVKQGSGSILLKRGTLITPSAKDVFYSKSRQIHFVE